MSHYILQKISQSNFKMLEFMSEGEQQILQTFQLQDSLTGQNHANKYLYGRLMSEVIGKYYSGVRI